MSIDADGRKYTSPDGSKTWEYLAILTCSIMSGCIGFVVGWNSPSIVILMSEDSPIPVTASSVSTLVAVVAVGHMLAPPINIFIVDKFGRKNTLLFSALPLLVSWSLITIATSIWELYVARFLAGITLGLFICVAPIYIGEISSPDTRGAGGSLTTIIYNIESPYFFVMRNRIDEAEEVLEKLRGKCDISEELQTIIDSLSKKTKQSSKSGNLKDIFTSKANFRAFLSIMLFAVTQHFGGFFTILTYGQLIFKSINNIMSDYVVNVVIGAVQLISALVTTLLVDKFGRKPLILASGVSAAICNFVIGFYFFLKEYMHADVLSVSWIPFISSLILIFTFNCGLLCLQIILMSEIFATEIKAISTCLVGVVGGLLATLGSKLYIWIAITLNYGHSLPFFVYFVVVAVCTAIILHVTPETKGKTFAEIQIELGK
ncbi:facilitated trehalose transporter Tret1-like isoform X2 [Bombus bifarius]|uniref:Facilitated trehalose transporter Tret1-like isoform X2 n=1 Tax=Bombus bifarius TaxID=103933 RepID=A0A6P8N039_9HYME|nr:facilitated trehalose transporter Tret1-like isoform X2 [Bombus vancouverensis nearcticus]XP_033314124.1 facilitated trehalose transporter Tret1-like isoform X2 [Bombus bifarius]